MLVEEPVMADDDGVAPPGCPVDPEPLRRCAAEVLQIMEKIHEEQHKQGLAQAVSVTVLCEQAKAQTEVLQRLDATLQRMVLWLVGSLIVTAFGLRGLEMLARR